MKKTIPFALALLLTGCEGSLQLGSLFQAPVVSTGGATLTPTPVARPVRRPGYRRAGTTQPTGPIVGPGGTQPTGPIVGPGGTQPTGPIVGPGGTQQAVPVVVTGSTIFGTADETNSAWFGQVYAVPATTSKLPDFATLNPSGIVFTNKLDIAPTTFTGGFPGVDTRTELFGVQYEGPVDVSTEGDYTFALISDDGAKVWIDDTLILDNDGTHTAQRVEQKVHLAKATYFMKVAYFNGAGNTVALQVRVKAPNVAEQALTPKL